MSVLSQLKDVLDAAAQAGRNYQLTGCTGLMRKECPTTGRLWLAWSAELDTTKGPDECRGDQPLPIVPEE